MCTAISYNAYNHYFGRNLDLERRYGESITITPRNFIFKYKSGEIERKHFAMIGTAAVIDDYPLYFDATNEHGLCMAGLNFVGNAFLSPQIDENRINLAPYELIPYILGKCKNVTQGVELLRQISIVDITFNEQLHNSELHWIISDPKESFSVEYINGEMKLHPNYVGVLTNNPPFEYQMINLSNYMQLSSEPPESRFLNKIILKQYSNGMGAIGLPGDLSSASRFVRAVFVKLNSVIPQTDIDCVSQMFHILSSVEQQEGCVKIGDKYERTQYMCCCNTESGVYYYRTYENSQITAVDLHKENLDSDQLILYEMIYSQQIKYMN